MGRKKKEIVTTEPEDTCTNPACEKGYIVAERDVDGFATIAGRCPDCNPGELEETAAETFDAFTERCCPKDIDDDCSQCPHGENNGLTCAHPENPAIFPDEQTPAPAGEANEPPEVSEVADEPETQETAKIYHFQNKRGGRSMTLHSTGKTKDDQQREALRWNYGVLKAGLKDRYDRIAKLTDKLSELREETEEFEQRFAQAKQAMEQLAEGAQLELNFDEPMGLAA